MKLFITGGTGFIGKHVVNKLKHEGHELLLLSRKSETSEYFSEEKQNVTVVEGDLSNINHWKKEVEIFQPNTAIHLAWEGIPDYGCKTSLNNLKYGLDLYMMLAELGCKRVVSTGSCWEYGLKHGELNEDLPVKPSNAFTASKNALNWVGKEIAKENNMKFIWTRLFYVYGPGQKETSLIPYIINCGKKGKTPEIKTPFVKNDFVYVEDVANAIFMIVENCMQDAVFNIGSGYSTCLQDIINIIDNYYGLQFSQQMIPPKSDYDESSVDFWANIYRINKEIGWGAKTNISDGIEKIISYMDE